MTTRDTRGGGAKGLGGLRLAGTAAGALLLAAGAVLLGETVDPASGEVGNAVRPAALPAQPVAPGAGADRVATAQGATAQGATAQAAKPPFFTLPPALRTRAAGAAGDPRALGRVRSRGVAVGASLPLDEAANPLVAAEVTMVLPTPAGAVPAVVGSLPVATGSLADAPVRRGFFQDMYDSMTAPDTGAEPRRWTPVHDPDPAPSRFIKGRPVTTRSPDLEFDLNERTSVGVYGEVIKPEKGDPLVGTGLAKTRDHGAGVTLQYKFGSH